MTLPVRYLKVSVFLWPNVGNLQLKDTIVVNAVLGEHKLQEKTDLLNKMNRWHILSFLTIRLPLPQLCML